MADAGACPGEAFNRRAVQLDTVRMPDIIAKPAHIFGVIARFKSELRQTVRDIVIGLRQVRMQMRAISPRQRRRFRASNRR